MTIVTFSNKFKRAINRLIRKQGNHPVGAPDKKQLEILFQQYVKRGEPDMKRFVKEIILISEYEEL